jgi:RimJ/RimL family protein N-acetyltransferase
VIRLRTARLDLVRADAAMLRDDARNRDDLARRLNAMIPSDWPPELFSNHQEMFADKLDSGVWTAFMAPWYWILDDGATRTLIGSGGVFPSTAPGDVLCGYAIVPSFHGRGFATEAMRALLAWAFEQPGVERIVADTFPHLRPSIRVMEKLGMTPMGPGDDPGAERRGVTRADFARLLARAR